MIVNYIIMVIFIIANSVFVYHGALIPAWFCAMGIAIFALKVGNQ